MILSIRLILQGRLWANKTLCSKDNLKDKATFQNVPDQLLDRNPRDIGIYFFPLNNNNNKIRFRQEYKPEGRYCICFSLFVLVYC